MSTVDGPVRTDNDFLLGANRGGIVPLAPVRIQTRQQAYRTAAWIEAMGEGLPEEDPASTYDEIRSAIRSC